MTKNKKIKDRIKIIYSTDPNYNYQYSGEEEIHTLEPSQQNLTVSLDRKHRKGKTVTIVSGFIGTDEDLNSLGKQLKSLCGTGGTVKENIILLQGNFSEKIIAHLQKHDYSIKRKGG